MNNEYVVIESDLSEAWNSILAKFYQVHFSITAAMPFLVDDRDGGKLVPILQRAQQNDWLIHWSEKSFYDKNQLD